MHSLDSFQALGRAYRSKKQDPPYLPEKTTGLDSKQDGGFDGSKVETLLWLGGVREVFSEEVQWQCG